TPVEPAVPAADRPQRLRPHEQVVRGKVVHVADGPERPETEAEPSASEGRFVVGPGHPLAPGALGRRDPWATHARDRGGRLEVPEPAIEPAVRGVGVVVEKRAHIGRDALERRVSLLGGARVRSGARQDELDPPGKRTWIAVGHDHDPTAWPREA